MTEVEATPVETPVVEEVGAEEVKPTETTTTDETPAEESAQVRIPFWCGFCFWSQIAMKLSHGINLTDLF